MRLTSSAIQRLLSASERTLAASASAQALKDLTAARLRAKVDRARRLKDKYDGLARTRVRAGRGKAAPRGGAARTDAATMQAKAAVFDELLRRFTAQLEKVERTAARAATPAGRKARARETVARVKRRVAKQEGQPAPASDAVAKTNTKRRAVSRASKAAHVERKLAASHLTRAHAHIGARTRRRQGRRDSR
jgi:hypothetical protein